MPLFIWITLTADSHAEFLRRQSGDWSQQTVYNLPLVIAKSSKIHRFFLLAGLLLAFLARFHMLDGQSFWNDEGNSARLSERSLQLILEGTASDIHPPLYYLGLRGWRELAGETEFALRAFSAFAGLLTVAFASALAQAVIGRRWAAVGALWLTAVNPALVYYSQEARMYALLGLLATASTWLLARLVNQWSRVKGQGSRVKGLLSPSVWGVMVVYVLCAAAGLYTHYFFPAVLLAHNLLVLFWLLKQIIFSPSGAFIPALLFGQWAAMMLATWLLYLPWLPVALAQLGGPPEISASFWLFGREAFRWMAFGATLPPTAVSWAPPLVGILIVWGVVYGRFRAALPVVSVVLPLLFMFAVGAARPELFKFLVVVIPPLAVLLAWPLAGKRRWLAALLLLALLPGVWQSLTNMYYDPAYARPDYRDMARRIVDEAHPEAGIILNAPNQWEVFTYYYRGDAPVYSLPRGLDQPTPAEIDDALRQIAAAHGRIYAIFWGEAQRDPQRLVERWLDAHTFKAVDEWVGDVRFVVYAAPDEPAAEMETAVDLPFGKHITLKGYTLGAVRVLPGDVVPVTLFWETAAALSQRYKVFLHLVDESGQLVTQRDSEPGGGLALTTTWQPGQPIIDNHGLLIPATLPDGRYTLWLGLYDVADAGQRLPIQTADGPADAFQLAIISIYP